MCTATVPASAGDVLGLVESLLGGLSGEAAAELPAEVVAGRLRAGTGGLPCAKCHAAGGGV